MDTPVRGLLPVSYAATFVVVKATPETGEVGGLVVKAKWWSAPAARVIEEES